MEKLRWLVIRSSLNNVESNIPVQRVIYYRSLIN